MDAVYSVGTNNRFAFFIDNDDDPGDVIPTPSTKKEEATKSAKTKGTSKQQGTKGGKGKENKDKVLQQVNKKVTENGTKRESLPFQLTHVHPVKLILASYNLHSEHSISCASLDECQQSSSYLSV